MRGREIRDARVRAALTQAEVAERLGVTQPTISNWEQDRTTPTADQEAALRRFLEIGETPGLGDASLEASPYGAWLSRARFSKGWTPAELAEKASLSAAQVYNIESGRTLNPLESTRRRLNEALETAPSQETVDATAAAAAVEGLGSLKDFDPYSDDQLPTQSGVYVLYDISQRPVYVGEGQDIRVRILSHGEKFWFKQPIVQTAAFIEIEDRGLRRKIEQILIRFLKSNAVLNKQHVQRGRDDG